MSTFDVRRRSATRPVRIGPAVEGHGESARDPAAVTAAAINLLIGAWLSASFWILDYSAADPGWSAIACGPAVMLLALARLTGASSSRVWSAAGMATGAWLAVAGLTIATSPAAQASFFECGSAVFVMAIVPAALPSACHDRSGARRVSRSRAARGSRPSGA